MSFSNIGKISLERLVQGNRGWSVQLHCNSVAVEIGMSSDLCCFS